MFTHRFSPGCTDIGHVFRGHPILSPIISRSFLFVVLKCNTFLAPGCLSQLGVAIAFPIRNFCAGKFVVPRFRPRRVVSVFRFEFSLSLFLVFCPRTGLPRQTTTRTMRPRRGLEWSRGPLRGGRGGVAQLKLSSTVCPERFFFFFFACHQPRSRYRIF